MREIVYVLYRKSPDIVDKFVEIKGIFKDPMKGLEYAEELWKAHGIETYQEQYTLLDTLED